MNLYLVSSAEKTPDGAYVVLADTEAIARALVTARNPGGPIAKVDLVQQYPDVTGEPRIAATISVTPARSH